MFTDRWLNASIQTLVGVTVVLVLAAHVSALTQETVLYKFSKTEGCEPGSMIWDTSGNLYGTESEGGAFNAGGVFELSPGSGGGWSFTQLYTFTGETNGANPVSLIFDSAGNLYGVTEGGGSHAAGTIYKLAKQSGGNWTESVLYNFQGAPDGSQPDAALIFDKSGNLYGTASSGGPSGGGSVFELSPGSGGTWSYKVLYAFGTDEGWPSGVVFDASGNLYGETFQSDVVFKLTPGSDGNWTESVIYNSPEQFWLNGGLHPPASKPGIFMAQPAVSVGKASPPWCLS